MPVQHMTDDLDMAGHHIVDWRYLEDIPIGNAAVGQALVCDGTHWVPGTVASGGTVDWSEITGIPTVFPPDSHTHVSADITDWLTTELHVFALYSQTWLVTNEQLNDDPLVLHVLNPSGSPDGTLSFMTTSGPYWYTNNEVRIGNVTTANAILRLGNGIVTDGWFYLGQELLTSHSTRGLCVSRALYVATTAHISSTSTWGGLATAVNGVSTDTLLEYTANAGVTVDGMKIKDSSPYTDAIYEKTANTGVTVDGVLLKDNGVTSTWTTVGANRTNITSSQTLVTSGAEFGTTYKLLDCSLGVTAASGTTVLQTFQLLNLSMTVTNSTPAFYAPTLYVVGSTVNAGGLNITVPSGSTQPVHFIFTNPGSAQAFGEGYFSVDVSGTTGDVIAAYTKARVTGSANGYGYRGYATGASGATGSIVGVDGYVVMVTGSTHAAVVALSGTLIGSAVAADKRMGLRVQNHILNSGGSVIITAAGSTTPNGVSTTHLNFASNTGELYVKNSAEFDGEVFMDGNTSVSVATTTSASYTAAAATVILANANSNNITVNLPAASGKTGRVYVVKKIDSSVNTVTIDGNSAETIDGAATVVLSTQYDVRRLVCDGTNWMLI